MSVQWSAQTYPVHGQAQKSLASVAPLPSLNTSGDEWPRQDEGKVAPVEALNELRSKLQIQREVNKELKRLLVASVGEEVQTKFEKIVTERASLSYELGKSVQQLSEGNEELECMSIQCDVWRSKFTASRLMIDQLANWKDSVFTQYKEYQNALEQVLTEHQQMYQQLTVTNSHLKQLSTMMSSKRLAERPHVLVRPVQMPVENHNLVELANENCQLSSDIVKTSDNVPHFCDNWTSRTLTRGEQLATQLLNKQGEDVEACQTNTDNKMISHNLSGTIRAFLSSREDHTDVKFKCRSCKGQVFVV